MTSFVTSRRGLLAGAATLAGALTVLPVRVLAQNARKGVLKYATLGLDTSDPHRHTGSIAVQQSYVEALTSIAANGAVEPFLAESFAVSPDGLTYTFRLREGVRFHNGDLLTARDVAANFERVKSKVKGGWLVSALQQVSKLETPDDRTVVVTLDEPFAPFLNLLSELWILSPKSAGWDETISLPIGTGPFTFGDWQPKVKLVTPAFADYWKAGAPRVEAVEFDLRDGIDKSLALRAGDLHIVSVDLQAAQDLQKAGVAEISGLKDTAWYFAAFNNRKPRKPFDDIRVRRALMHAVDKAAVMNFVGGDKSIVTNQLVASGNIYFDQALHDADEFRKPDLDQARKLLAEAGVTPEDHTIEFVSWQETHPQIVVQMVRKLGFKVNHVALDDIGTQKRLGQYDWDMSVTNSGPRSDIFLRFVRLMSDGPNPVLWGGIQDPELDSLIKQAVREPDSDKRKEFYLQAFRRTMEKGYFFVLGHAPDFIAIRNGIKGYDPGFTWACHWASGGVAVTAIDA
ncbi:ABC-type transport system substrate-binding protein [Pseudochelatococcus lubricantis]|uniref:ABC-type transport system substrate-binding protein n=1 Tax=Pseudochelatococcus lubricantis TaxID=1538102 RepID=A0ABX0V638_9HYPH|nr:ABC transporter substrate-binding protein [Pseudochelatococcus lubricantis]NIJ59954.1 ABC-type transport system substrate-binding protein [Pseudochelatococcus lubricantis]